MHDNKLKILVTGSAGFIGATFCHKVLKLKHRVLGVDNYSNSLKSSTEILKSYHAKNFSFEDLDLTRKDNVFIQKLESFRPDLVVHFAALKSVSVSEIEPDLYWKNNLDSTVNVIKAMHEVGCRKLIFSSSASVYGKHNTQPVNEDSDLDPASVYGKTKLACENVIKEYCKEGFLDAVIFRYFNLSGCHEDRLFFETPKTSENLMTKLIEVAKGNKEKITIFGKEFNTQDGTATRDYIHIEDLLDAHMIAIDFLKENKGCEVFNLGTGKETTVLELLKVFEESNGVKVQYKIGKPRLGDVSRSYTNASKFERVSGWKAQKSLKDICFDSWAPNKL
tara:strand:+ start:2701 stop:3705 length:1005 start_codon:yes stop_codon:yes gene_type:complete